MARPRKEGLDYFPHDTDAANDPDKVKPLRLSHGLVGYGFYFFVLERIYRSPDCELDISTPLLRRALIKDIGVKEKTFNTLLTTCLDLQLFYWRQTPNGVQLPPGCGRLASCGADKRFGQVQGMREMWRQKHEQTGEFSPEQTPQGKLLENSEKTGVIQGFSFRESKAKESKDKENNKETGYLYREGKLINGATREVTEISVEQRGAAHTLWAKVLVGLKQRVSGPNYRTWLEDTKGLCCQDHNLWVIAHASQIAYLINHQAGMVRQELIQVTNDPDAEIILVLEGDHVSA